MRVWLTLIALLSIGLFTLQAVAGENCSYKAKNKSDAKVASADGASCSYKAKQASADGATCGTKAKLASEKSAGSCASSCGSKAKPASGSKAKLASTGTCATKSDDCLAACPSTIVKAAPKMKFTVANDNSSLTTSCPCTAKKAAEMLGSEIVFEVNAVKFDKQSDAMTAYTKQLESYLGNMTKVEFIVDGKKTCCPNDAAKLAKKSDSKVQYRVASVSFPNAELAKAAAKKAKKAANGVQMKYVVDGKEYKCSNKAGSKCSSDKEKMAYKVGENTTKCSLTAKAALLRERINAAAAVVATTAQEGQATASAG